MKTIVALAVSCVAFGADPLLLTPAKMPKVGTIDERFQSFNVEMVEVVGGRFWAPYRDEGKAAEAPAGAKLATPGIDPSLFRTREPIDLTNPRLRKLASGLGPSYVRVSGTWGNSTYFHGADSPAPKTPPEGFGGVLTRAQWKGVVDFSQSVNAKLVTSFTITAGVRDANGVWTPAEAAKLLAYTKSIGGNIAAGEFFNEPSFAGMGGAPKGYDAAAYGRDIAVWLPFVRKAAPNMLVLGPGSVGEGGPMAAGLPGAIKSEDMLKATGRGVDAFSYHFYGGVSKRCGGNMGSTLLTSPEAALSEEWLSRTDRDLAFYSAVRDRFEPGKPIWLTETGETACGGNPWASTFTDTFRYVDQMGRLAKKGVQVIMHNTLAASDYGLIDEVTMTPRPSYWAALTWSRLMSKTVLDAGPAPEGVHLYAHCLPGHEGGVTVLAINLDRGATHSLRIANGAERYTLGSSAGLGSSTVALNGTELKLVNVEEKQLPGRSGVRIAAGEVKLAPATITFLAMPDAGNASCRLLE
jgi:heparanase 1